MAGNTKHLYRATWVGIFVNLFLTIIKVVGGLIAGSQGLIADGLHSASGIMTSIVILFSVRISNKPINKEHPYGYGKADHVATLIVAMVLFVVGFQIFMSSTNVFFGKIPTAPDQFALMIITISIITKELLFRYKMRIGKKYDSTALISDAWHHRSDALSSLAVLIGVGLAILGETFNVGLLIYGDALAGMIVSFIIIKVGYNLAKESSHVILEKVLSDEDMKKYENTIRSIDKIKHVDELLARTHGSYIIIDLRISVDSRLSVREGHNISKSVKKALLKNHPEVRDVYVHVDPFN